MFFVEPYVQMIPNWSENLHDTQTQHILNIYHSQILVRHVLVGVNPCEKCRVVAPLPQIAMLPTKLQNNGFKICEMI
jgi:hypothetical protein